MLDYRCQGSASGTVVVIVIGGLGNLKTRLRLRTRQRNEPPLVKKVFRTRDRYRHFPMEDEHPQWYYPASSIQYPESSPPLSFARGAVMTHTNSDWGVLADKRRN